MDQKKPEALILRHVAFEGPGVLSRLLPSLGFSMNMIEAPDGGLSALTPRDLLVILGGPIGAYEENDYPFLLEEMALIESHLSRGVPVIGICLGSQLLARVLGAKVYPGKKKEIGWEKIQLTPEGVRSSLGVKGGVTDVPVLHWHGDTFDLPGGAVRLAGTELTPNQAFSLGNQVLALQFHLEATAFDLERWFVGHTLEIATTPGISVQALREQTRKYGQRCEMAGENVFRDFLSKAGFP